MLLKLNELLIIKCIGVLWISDPAITNKTIFNSFKYSWISNSLDENEDGQFRGYEDIEKGNEIIQIQIESDDDYDYLASSNSDE